MFRWFCLDGIVNLRKILKVSYNHSYVCNLSAPDVEPLTIDIQRIV